MDVRRRIFIAVTLAEALRASVAGVRATLGDAAGRLRWVPPENLHLTIRFLGEITEAQVRRAVEATRETVATVPPFAITVAGVGAFPTSRAPRIVWVGVTEGADRLGDLAGTLEAALRRRKFQAEARPFQAHLTVARARSEGRLPDLTTALVAAPAFVAGTQRVDTLVVMESVLGPSGPIYTEVAREAFGRSE